MKVESEKLLESKLRKTIEAMGGMCLKIPAIHHAGIPDRICLIPIGRILFVEVKTTKKKSTKLQLLTHEKLRRIGFAVQIIDTSEQIKRIPEQYAN